jgi:hypothetical protein
LRLLFDQSILATITGCGPEKKLPAGNAASPPEASSAPEGPPIHSAGCTLLAALTARYKPQRRALLR